MYCKFRIFWLLMLGLLTTACASGPGAANNESLPIPDATITITEGDLRIGPMDSLKVDVFGVDELDGVHQVDFNGNIKLPLIGEVAVIGMTAGELSFELQNRYGETYLQDPDVNVTISESTGRRITVDGSINSPGLYPITGKTSLLQAVALGGGPAEGANLRKVVVFRQIQGERHAAAFDLMAIRNGQQDDPQVYGNDIIIVDGSEARQTYGEILRSLPLLALFMAF